MSTGTPRQRPPVLSAISTLCLLAHTSCGGCSVGTLQTTCRSDDECPAGFRCDTKQERCAAVTDAGPQDRATADFGTVDSAADGATADRAASDAARADVATSDTAAADVSIRDTVVADVAASDAVAVDSAAAEAGPAPDAVRLDATRPDAALVDTGNLPPCVRYVRADVALGGDGLSWTTAMSDIQQAIDAAALVATSARWCNVLVAGGRYRVYRTGATDTLKLGRWVAVYGGFAGDETVEEIDRRDPAQHPTLITGLSEALDGRVLHVITGDGDAAIDGFSIVSGAATGVGHQSGGGLLHTAGSLSVRNCLFSDNDAQARGGAIHSVAGNLTVDRCDFTFNRAGEYGSAIWSGGVLTVERSRFVGNAVTGSGTVLAAGAAPARIESCIFVGNIATQGGSALHAAPGNALTVVNCTATGNADATGGTVRLVGAATTIVNSILWSSATPAIDQQASMVTVSHSDVSGGWSGQGNIDADPLFLDHPSAVWSWSTTWSSVAHLADTGRTALTVSKLNWAPHTLAGMYLRPKMGDLQRWAIIVDNSASDIIVAGDVTGWAAAGDSFELYDLRLRADSPCIDSAADQTASVAAPWRDLEGRRRIDHPRVANTGSGGNAWFDMGALELGYAINGKDWTHSWGSQAEGYPQEADSWITLNSYEGRQGHRNPGDWVEYDFSAVPAGDYRLLVKANLYVWGSSAVAVQLNGAQIGVLDLGTSGGVDNNGMPWFDLGAINLPAATAVNLHLQDQGNGWWIRIGQVKLDPRD